MPTISSISPLVYTEGSPGGLVDPNITITGATAYTEGYIEFATSASAAGDQFTLTSAADGNVVGAISAVGQDVFLGNGTGRDRIGSIDQTFNGQDGQPLRILFASPLPNAGFEEGEANWSIKDEQYGDGGSELNLDSLSIQLATDKAYTGGTGTTNIQASAGMSYDGNIATGQGIDGTRALYLGSGGGIVGGDQLPGGGYKTDGYGSIHGPYATSAVITVQTGDSLSLDFRAVGTSDDYEVFGFLRRVDANGDFISNSVGDTTNNIQLFAQRGDDTGGYATISKSGLPGGNYRFEFVGGTYDGTGGLAVGSNLYVDNIRLISSTTVTDNVAQNIARQVAYTNTGDDAPPSRTITVTAVDAAGVSGSSTGQLDFTPENDSPTLANVTLASIAEDEVPVGVTITAAFTSAFGDPDNAYSPTDSMAGILITGNAAATSEGIWQYSTNGTDWREVGPVSLEAGLLLSASTLLRFLPASDWNGTPGALEARSVDSTYTGTFTQDTARVTFDATSDNAVTSPVGQKSAPVSIVVTAVNDAPVSVDTQGTGVEDTPVNGQLALTDPDGDALTYALVQGAQDADGNAVAGLTFNTDGSYSFQGPQDFYGTVSFTYTANDGTMASAPATVTLAVTGTADAPVAPVLADQAGTEDQAVTFQVPAFVDMDGDALAYTATLADGTALPGWLVFDPATRSFSGQPPANFAGLLALTVSADDGQAVTSSTFTLTMAGVADAPTAQAGTSAGIEGATITGQVVATDPDGDALTYALVQSAQDADGNAVAGLTFNTDGSYSFQGPQDFYGTVSFAYTANDGTLASAPATVTLEIASDNLAPLAVSDRFGTPGQSKLHDGALARIDVGSLLSNDVDPEGELLTFAGIVAGPTQGTLKLVSEEGRNVLVYDYEGPQLAWNKAVDDTFTYRVVDSEGATSTASVRLKVTGMTTHETAGTRGDNTLHGSDLAHDVINAGSGDDLVYGRDGHDTLSGSRGHDRLLGEQGDDYLYGGSGNDTLIGGLGKDRIFAGNDTGQDIIVFKTVDDSSTQSRDIIYRFDRGEDLINLRGIDANVDSASTDDMFAFSDLQATAHSVWWQQTDRGVVVSADVSGDANADFRFRLSGVTGITADDFLL